jgi:hypothetical protein
VTIYAGALQTMSTKASGLTTGVLFIPHYPFAMIMTVGLAALMLIFLFDTIDYFVKGIKNLRPADGVGRNEIAKDEVAKALSDIAN